MKSAFNLATALATGVAAVSASAAASDPTFRLFGGVTLEPEIGAEASAAYYGYTVALSQDFELDSGFVFGGAAGVDFGDFVIDAELAYRSSDLEGALTYSGYSTYTYQFDESVGVISAMVNGWFELPVAAGFELYAGGGVGVAAGIIEDIDPAIGIAYQLGAGARFNVTEYFGVGVGYRYFDTADIIDDSGITADYKDSSLMFEAKFKL